MRVTLLHLTTAALFIQAAGAVLAAERPHNVVPPGTGEQYGYRYAIHGQTSGRPQDQELTITLMRSDPTSIVFRERPATSSQITAMLARVGDDGTLAAPQDAIPRDVPVAFAAINELLAVVHSLPADVATGSTWTADLGTPAPRGAGSESPVTVTAVSVAANSIDLHIVGSASIPGPAGHAGVHTMTRASIDDLAHFANGSLRSARGSITTATLAGQSSSLALLWVLERNR